MAETKEKKPVVTKEILENENIKLSEAINNFLVEDERVRKVFSDLLVPQPARALYSRRGRPYNDFSSNDRSTEVEVPAPVVYSWEGIAFLVGQISARSGYKEMLAEREADKQLIQEQQERLQHFEEEERRRRER